MRIQRGVESAREQRASDRLPRVRARGLWWPVALAATWLLSVQVGVAAPVGKPGVFLDPWTSPASVQYLLDHQSTISGFGVVYIMAFSNGQAAWPSTAAPFYLPAGSAVRKLLPSVTAACRRQRVPIAWVIDLWRWERAGLPSPGLFRTHPEWFERGKDAVSSPQEPSKYASPYKPSVLSEVLALADEMAHLANGPDGFVLRAELSSTFLLGFSTEARLASIEAVNMDTLDVLGHRPAAQVRPWAEFRAKHMAGLVRDIAGRLRDRDRNTTVAVWGRATVPFDTMVKRAAVAANWLDSMRDGSVQDALLDASWFTEEEQAVWGCLRQIEGEVGLGSPLAQAAKERGPQLVGSDRPEGPAVTKPNKVPTDAQTAPDPLTPASDDGARALQGVTSRLHPIIRSRDVPSLPSASCVARRVAALQQAGAPLQNAVFMVLHENDWPAVVAAAARLSKGAAGTVKPAGNGR